MGGKYWRHFVYMIIVPTTVTRREVPRDTGEERDGNHRHASSSHDGHDDSFHAAQRALVEKVYTTSNGIDSFTAGLVVAAAANQSS
jgi:hypothetical protein